MLCHAIVKKGAEVNIASVKYLPRETRLLQGKTSGGILVEQPPPTPVFNVNFWENPGGEEPSNNKAQKIPLRRKKAQEKRC